MIMLEDFVKTDSEVFIKVRDIVNKYDPMGLLKMGCPVNEYEFEVTDILLKCRHCYTVKGIKAELRKIFQDWFKTDIDDVTLSYMANELLWLFKGEKT